MGYERLTVVKHYSPYLHVATSSHLNLWESICDTIN